eukprot:scaffold1436_cov250-Pinguiococcus_pyrenoidosus.AAC.3
MTSKESIPSLYDSHLSALASRRRSLRSVANLATVRPPHKRTRRYQPIVEGARPASRICFSSCLVHSLDSVAGLVEALLAPCFRPVLPLVISTVPPFSSPCSSVSCRYQFEQRLSGLSLADRFSTFLFFGVGASLALAPALSPLAFPSASREKGKASSTTMTSGARHDSSQGERAAASESKSSNCARSSSTAVALLSTIALRSAFSSSSAVASGGRDTRMLSIRIGFDKNLESRPP